MINLNVIPVINVSASVLTNLGVIICLLYNISAEEFRMLTIHVHPNLNPEFRGKKSVMLT